MQVDPQLLFQRFSLLATDGTRDDPASYFAYELFTHPPALFVNSSLPCEAHKPAFAEALWKLVGDENEALPSTVHYVLIGRALLQRIPWSRGGTFKAVIERNVSYVTKHYGQATVIFYGYVNGPDTKDVTHLRRSHGSGPTIILTPRTVISLKNTDFLSNKDNKNSFLSILSFCLDKAECSKSQARGDADVMIAKRSKYVEARDLPPSAASEKFHNLPLYYQIQDWSPRMGMGNSGPHAAACEMRYATST